MGYREQQRLIKLLRERGKKTRGVWSTMPTSKRKHRENSQKARCANEQWEREEGKE